MTYRILIEGEYPALSEAAFAGAADEFIGYRFWFSAKPEKKSAILLKRLETAASAKMEIPLSVFENSYAVFNEASLAHAEAIADYYLAPLEDVLALMAPPVPKRKQGALADTPRSDIHLSGSINDKQKEILETITATPADIFSEHLIWGVTGSGKTRVYEHLIAAALEKNQQTLLLVPEIALSGQLMEVITARFPGETVLYHSGLSDGERIENYRRFVEGKARVAVGTRSAIFLPAHDLGQIIIDEEHDASFKDQRKIRFDARTVARLRLGGRAKLILGSATPSLESLGRAKTGEAKLHRLRQRATGQAMPEVFIPEYKAQHGLISPFLAEKMREHLAAGNQVLLLMNRRGHSTHVHCPTCEAKSAEGQPTTGYAECPRCAVALTYHKDNQLRCHYCGFREAYTATCPRDGALRQLSGRGIQRVEEILDTQFSGFEYARLDRDTTRTKGFTEEVLAEMRSGKIRILIGTQMIAKGFDIEGVTLVGVLAIDQTLASPDFRAGETAWQLLAQVVGRSGRHRPGEVVIQTMTPHHAAIRAAQEHDADSFYAAEAAYRKLTKYPPFGTLARLVLIADNEAVLFAAADRLAGDIQPENTTDMFATEATPGVTLLGPASPSVAKIENEFRVHFIIKGEDAARLRLYLKRIKPIITRLENGTAGIRAILDIDPREVM